MTDIETRIRDSFARQSMMQTLGAEIDEVSEGKVVITAPILPSSRQQHDVAHAALSFAIGDTAAGYAALTKMPDDQEVMTAEIKINLLAPGAGDYLRATGRVIKPGRRLVVVTAEVHAITESSEKLIAILQGTMVPVAKQG
ncbi:PaaI family thioesterase [Parasedimentitalea huanghaiensis]|uniref:Medium/long-chain acyl-CoA thioesterase YigI n=1 Tax=Parasedimentitalea huanghaiensis TaxID=2682100 RepID=A0A6L6WHH9_9RHOB|nr:PaaI family thioesterase [Zongyanglinia huanghaiensis]MVO16771.1 hotdog fold thioesterase [Zongyanglinia huanghaiensis]